MTVLDRRTRWQVPSAPLEGGEGDGAAERVLRTEEGRREDVPQQDALLVTDVVRELSDMEDVVASEDKRRWGQAGGGWTCMHDQGAPFGRRHASNLCQRGVCERYADVLRLAPVQTVTALLGLQGL